MGTKKKLSEPMQCRLELKVLIRINSLCTNPVYNTDWTMEKAGKCLPGAATVTLDYSSSF